MWRLPPSVWTVSLYVKKGWNYLWKPLKSVRIFLMIVRLPGVLYITCLYSKSNLLLLRSLQWINSKQLLIFAPKFEELELTQSVLNMKRFLGQYWSLFMFWSQIAGNEKENAVLWTNPKPAVLFLNAFHYVSPVQRPLCIYMWLLGRALKQKSSCCAFTVHSTG